MLTAEASTPYGESWEFEGDSYDNARRYLVCLVASDRAGRPGRLWPAALFQAADRAGRDLRALSTVASIARCSLENSDKSFIVSNCP